MYDFKCVKIKMYKMYGMPSCHALSALTKTSYISTETLGEYEKIKPIPIELKE